jgi:hypothetical protein
MKNLVLSLFLAFTITGLFVFSVTSVYAVQPSGKPQACDPSNPGKAIGNKHCEVNNGTPLTACDTSGEKDENGTPIDSNPDGKIDYWELLDHQTIGATIENVQTWISISEDNVNHNDSINGFIDTQSEVSKLNDFMASQGVVAPCI